MKKLLIAGLAALTLIPSTAMAAPTARDVQRAHQNVVAQRHDVRQARWDYAREVRAYNQAHPWRAGFRYHRFAAGERIQAQYYGRAYVVSDYGRFHWARPGANQVWVRHYNDALLVNTHTGRVIRVTYNAFR